MTKAVLFDLDGTLLNTLADLTDASNHALSIVGSSKRRTLEEVRSYVGDGARTQMTRVLDNNVDDDLIEKTLRIYQAYYNDHLVVNTVPYPGIPSLLDALREKGIKTAVVSNKYTYATKVICNTLLPGRIDVLIGGEKGLKKKPAPDSLLKAASLLGVSPADCVMIGDGTTDILSGIAAGMKTIGVSWGYRDSTLLNQVGANVIAETVEELANMLLNEE